MTVQATYSSARANLAKLLRTVTENRETVIVRRRGAADVAMISADELESLTETSHLLRSPKNARRLLAALMRAQKETEKSQTVSDLRKEMGIDKKR